jgi:hypothetical protein
MLDFLQQVPSELLKAVPIVEFLFKAIASIASAFLAIYGLYRWKRRFHRRRHLTENKTQSKGKQQEQLPPQLLNPQMEELPTGERTDPYQFADKEDTES